MVRIEQAKKLLASTNMNTCEISSSVGYSDPKYFSKLFKRIAGMPIHALREKEDK